MQHNQRLQLEGDCFSGCLGGTWEVTSWRVCVRNGDEGPLWDGGKGNWTWDMERPAGTDTHQQMLEERGHDVDYWHWEE